VTEDQCRKSLVAELRSVKHEAEFTRKRLRSFRSFSAKDVDEAFMILISGIDQRLEKLSFQVPCSDEIED
jgi:hypothetical protein